MEMAMTLGSLWICSAAIGVPQLAAFTITGGGGRVSGGTITLEFTIGQSDATGIVLRGGAYEVCGGYWPGFSAPACAADFNRDGGVDFFDYLDFVDVFSQGILEADFNPTGPLISLTTSTL